MDRGAWWATVHGSQRVTFIRKAEFEYRHTQRECHVKIGAVQPQAKEPPEAAKEAWVDPLLAPSEAAWLCLS